MHERARWAAAAIGRVLRPVVRLALHYGVKYAQLDALLRRLLVEEARRLGGSGHRPNVSQISVTTGLNRVQVREVTHAGEGGLPQTGDSYAARTFTRWLQDAVADPARSTLPLTAAEGVPSFEALARLATRGNLHHRAVLAELLRLGLIERDGDSVSLCASVFVPTGDERSMLAFLGDNARDHLYAAVCNVEGQGGPFLERAVYSQGLAERDCRRVVGALRERWDGMHHQLVAALDDALDRVGEAPTYRVRLGVYAYYEPWQDERPVPLDDLPLNLEHSKDEE